MAKRILVTFWPCIVPGLIMLFCDISCSCRPAKWTGHTTPVIDLSPQP